MKKLTYRISSLIITLLMVITMLYVPQDDKVYADSAGVTIALSASTVRMGQSVTATISVSGSSISASGIMALADFVGFTRKRSS